MLVQVLSSVATPCLATTLCLTEKTDESDSLNLPVNVSMSDAICMNNS